MRNKLMSGLVSPQEVVRVVTSRPVADRRAFLGAWTMAAPSTEEAIEIRRAVEDSIEFGEVIEKETEPGKAKVPRLPPPEDAAKPPPTIFEIPPPRAPDAPSPYAAGALSFFFGMGIGNHYAGAHLYGIGVLVAEVVGILVAVAGAGSGESSLTILGLLTFVGGWIADWSGAVYHAVNWKVSPNARYVEGGRVGVQLIDLRF
ncbi:MAG: hypothetical protein RMA76_03450 [Deltaproteobacteria bacterium]